MSTNIPLGLDFWYTPMYITSRYILLGRYRWTPGNSRACRSQPRTKLRRTAEAGSSRRSRARMHLPGRPDQVRGRVRQGRPPRGWHCTCPDFELRQQPCKHVLAVEFTIRREITDEGEVVTQTVKVTYSQEWSAYNAAQCEEKDRFMPMLADLCSTIPNPPQGKGRPRLPRSDMAFTACPGLLGPVGPPFRLATCGRPRPRA